MNEFEDSPEPPRGRAEEAMFNAPVISLALIGLLAIAYAAQVTLLSPDQMIAGALSGRALEEGRWWTLLSHIFLHGGTVHILMNAGGALAFGPAVARHFGPGVRAATVFLLFFMVCGVAGGLGYVALHAGGLAPVVGASGAISGLWGGAARLLGRWNGLSGLWDGPARGQIIAVVVLNLLIALAGLAGGGLNIAWEAHIAGFLAGLLLMGPFSRLARPSYRQER